MRGIRAAIVVAGVLALAACGRGEDGRSGATGDWAADQAAAEPESVAVEALEVSSAPILAFVEASGTVRGINEATVVSEVEGLIQRAPFDLGQFVEEGEILAEVDATVARLSLEEAREAAESARLELAAVERRFEAGSASQTELTRARSALNGAQARLEAAQEQFDDHTIRAPISGFIASKPGSIGRGNYLSRGAAVARVVDLSRLRMEIAIGERELGFVSEGADARVTVPSCSETPYEASVRSIAAGSDPQTGSFPVVIEWENVCGTIRSGVSATARIAPNEAESRIIVPSAAIQREGQDAFVFVAGDGRVTRRAITLGERLGDRVQVTGGLDEGEVIVTSALSALSDGAPVEATVIGRTGDVL